MCVCSHVHVCVCVVMYMYNIIEGCGEDSEVDFQVDIESSLFLNVRRYDRRRF